MIFSSPLFLWALGLLTIPIIIHLFQFRRFKKVLFPDISMLREVQTKSKTKNELKHIIILISRMLFLAMLILAFSEPHIPAQKDYNDSEISIIAVYIDNSLSMQSRSEGFDLLTQAKQDAFDIIESYPNETQFQLITNDFSSAQRRLIDRETFTSRLDEIEFSPQVRGIEDVLEFEPNLQADPNRISTLYLMSDFIGNVDSFSVSEDSNKLLRIVKYGKEEVSNIAIDSVWHESPIIQVNTETEIMVRIRNYSPTPVLELPVKILLDGVVEATVLVTIESNNIKDTAISILPTRQGNIKGEVSIDDSPLTFDDNFYFNLDVRNLLKILEISESEETSPYAKLFGGPEYTYSKMNSNQLKFDSILDPDLVILNALTNYSSGLIAKINELSNSGNSILLSLPKSLDLQARKSLSDWLSISLNDWDTAYLDVNRIEIKDALFSNVFEDQPKNLNYPYAEGHWPINGVNTIPLLQLFNGDPLLSKVNLNQSSIFILSTPVLDITTNLHKHALIVPTLINMIGYNGQAKTPYFIIGDEKLRMKKPKLERIEIVSELDGSQFTPGLAYDGLVLNNQINKPGYYRIQTDTSLLQLVSFNYNKAESKTKATSEAELQNALMLKGYSVSPIDSQSEDLAVEVQNADFGIELWPFFLLAALIFFISETILIKLFK